MSARAPIRPGTLALLGLGAALSLAVGLRSTWQNSITVDEFGHLPAGLNLLQTGDMRYAELNPPLMNSLNALPLWLADVPAVQVPEGSEDSRYSFWSNGAWFMEQRRSDYVLLFERARAVTVGLTALMGLGAFGFARRLVPEHGDAAGLLAAALVWSSPEVLAHGALVTTDAGLAAFTLFSLSALHAWRVRPDAARAAGAGVLLGLCQLVKFSAVLLLPVVVGVLAHAVVTATEGRRARLGEAALLLAAAWLTLCAGYGFGGLGTPVGALSLGSAPLSALSGVWAGLPSPLPEAFLRAFDRQLADIAQGDPSYLLGEVYHERHNRATGLLNGLRCSTHWGFQSEFSELYPDVTVVEGSIVTEEKRIYSSGGANSYWNLLLYLLEKYTNRETAVLASKYFAIDINRDSQAAFAMFKGQRNHQDTEILRVQDYIEENITERLSVDVLSRLVNTGRRTLERRFKEATSNSIQEYIRRIKIEAAKRQFEQSRKNINEVMYELGYSDTKAFRDLFKKLTGLTPIEYRNKYSKITANPL